MTFDDDLGHVLKRQPHNVETVTSVTVSPVSVQILYPLKRCEASPGLLHRPTPSRQLSRHNSAVLDELEMDKSLILGRHRQLMVL